MNKSPKTLVLLLSHICHTCCGLIFLIIAAGQKATLAVSIAHALITSIAAIHLVSTSIASCVLCKTKQESAERIQHQLSWSLQLHRL